MTTDSFSLLRSHLSMSSSYPSGKAEELAQIMAYIQPLLEKLEDSSLTVKSAYTAEISLSASRLIAMIKSLQVGNSTNTNASEYLYVSLAGQRYGKWEIGNRTPLIPSPKNSSISTRQNYYIINTLSAIQADPLGKKHCNACQKYYRSQFLRRVSKSLG